MTTPDMPFRPDAAAASTDVLAADGGGGRRSRATALVLGAVAVLVLVIAGGVAIAAKFAGGGGAQPESVVPATAVAFAKIDLDPSAGQKLDAFRFINNFPIVDDRFNADEDLVKTLLQIAHDNGELTETDYDADIKPWLGKRMGFALLPATGGSIEPTPLVVLQVSDAAKAKAGLAKLFADSATDVKPGVAISGDYAVIASSESLAQSALTQAEQAALGDDKDFSGDLATLGEAGVGAAWLDMAGLTDLSLATGEAPPEQLENLLASGQAKGRFATVLRFDGPTLEMVGHVAGMQVPVDPVDGAVTNHLSDLPASTLAAVSVNHPDKIVEGVFKALPTLLPKEAQLDAMLDMVQKQFGLTLPDDAMTLLGSNIVVAVDADGVQDNPKIGMRAVTDTAAALSIVDRLEQVIWQMTNSTMALPRDETDDGYVVASTPDYAKELTEAGGLGASSRFTSVMPDAAGADAAFYLDVATLVDRYGSSMGAPAKVLDNLKPLDAFAVTMTNEGGGEASYLMRLTTR